MTPRETSTLLKSSSSSRIKTVVSGSQVTVSVWVRKSISTDSGGANYNGSQLRLIQVRNYSVGLTSDVVLATGSASLGVWELLSGTTSVTSGDIGAVEVYVDGDGNAGWFNVDDWSFS